MSAYLKEDGMNWARLVVIVVGSGVVSSLTDWFFAGDWIHRRYTYPEIWRQGAEGRAIALTSPLPFLTCGVFAYVTARLGRHSVLGAVNLAAALRLIGPWRLILTHAAFREREAFVAARSPSPAEASCSAVRFTRSALVRSAPSSCRRADCGACDGASPGSRRTLERPAKAVTVRTRDICNPSRRIHHESFEK